MKYLNFNDLGYFQYSDDCLLFVIDLSKQIVFSIPIVILGVFVIWRLFFASFIYSCFLSFIPLAVFWISGLLDLKDFIDAELNAISIRLKD